MNHPAPDFEIYTSLRINSLESSPDAVTKSLGLFPSRVSRKGEQECASGVESFAEDFGPLSTKNLWVLHSGLAAENTPLSAQIDALLGQLEGREEPVRKWAKNAWVTVEAYAHKAVPALTLTPEQMKRMAALGITLDVDFHDLTQTTNDTIEETKDA
ncbi:DUF4279 domain-containing protein [Kordiimonas sp.]|uniref:DUF4279 domain-containing protein n=1 Tax=Kordiimonas sp. TaxID=1970157 RepID=UPI003A8DB544